MFSVIALIGFSTGPLVFDLDEDQCHNTLVCHQGRCQCYRGEYWKNNICVAKNSINSSCEESQECRGKLLCLEGKCECQDNYYWKNDRCSVMHVIGSPCKDNDGCYRSLYCIHGTCKCATEDYWNGEICTSRKKVNASCLSSYECFGKLVCVRETCGCSEQHTWNGTDCKMIKIVGSPCLRTSECGTDLICSDGQCQCPVSKYTNGSICDLKTPLNGYCRYSSECIATLQCNKNTCQCPEYYQWNTVQCVPKKTGLPAFSVTISANTLPSSNAVIKFDTVISNIGNGYNSATGVFTAPRSGVFAFSVNFISSDTNYLEIHLIKNDVMISRGFSTNSQYAAGSTRAIMELKKGDRVYVKQTRGTLLGSKYSTFSGHMI